MMPHDKVLICYTNHRGETALRTITPRHFRFATGNLYHPESQWLLDAWDHEKEAVRTFAMKNVHFWKPLYD